MHCFSKGIVMHLARPVVLLANILKIKTADAKFSEVFSVNTPQCTSTSQVYQCTNIFLCKSPNKFLLSVVRKNGKDTNICHCLKCLQLFQNDGKFNRWILRNSKILQISDFIYIFRSSNPVNS